MSRRAATGSDGHSFALRADGTVVEFGGYGHTVPEGLRGVVDVQAVGWGGRRRAEAGRDGAGLGRPYAGAGEPPSGLGGVAAIAAGDGHANVLHEPRR